MHHLLAKTINLGTGQVSTTQAAKIKITNIASVIACIIAVSNALFFYLQLTAPIAAGFNLLFAIVYSFSLLLSYLQQFRAANILLFVAVMSHVFFLSTQIFTSASGFHFYYLLAPSCLFLMFDDEQKSEKSVLMVLAVILFFVCEYNENPTPLVDISSTAEDIIFSSTILAIMLETFLVTFVYSRAITQNELLLKQVASRDWLTGLNNRGTFVELGQKQIEYSQRYNKPLSLLMLDIDSFKHINDNYGHVVGDQVLKKIARTLKDGIRASDTLARYGGEEFVIILPETTSADAFELAQKLRQSIEDTPSMTDTKNDITCRVSVGVAQIDQEVDTLDKLTNSADLALYQAKESGRNRVCLYQSVAHQSELN